MQCYADRTVGVAKLLTDPLNRESGLVESDRLHYFYPFERVSPMLNDLGSEMPASLLSARLRSLVW